MQPAVLDPKPHFHNPSSREQQIEQVSTKVESPSIRNPANTDAFSRLADTRQAASTTGAVYLPWLAISLSCAIYAAHFFFGGGGNHFILDSFAYLQLSNGQQTGVPFNSRIAAPFFAALISSATGLSASGAFRLLTPVALLTSLLALRRIIRKRGGSAEWQAAVLLAFGCSLAVTFGYTPVLVDPMLLLLTCLTLVALDGGHWLTALALACVAALTKEYGVLLGLVWSVQAYRRGFRKYAFLGLVLPVTALLIVLLARHTITGVGFGNWSTFASHLMFEYQLSVFRVRGPVDYAKLAYMWTWCGLWPVFLMATSVSWSGFGKRAKMTADQMGFAILLAALPVLLLGDWTRNLIIVVPFACIVASAHPLARNRRFLLILAIGGLSTALARPFHSEIPPPLLLTLTFTGISAISSLVIVMILVRYSRSRHGAQPTPQLNRTAPEVAAT